MQHNSDHAIHELYVAWREAEARAHRVFDEVYDDDSHPRYVEAHTDAHAMLLKLLTPSSSLHGALIKLKIACQYEDFIKESQDLACTYIVPKAIVAALHDLESFFKPSR